MQQEFRYWAYRGFEQQALQKGSFIRRNNHGEYDKFSSGMFIGSLTEIDPNQFNPVDTQMALSHLPTGLADRFMIEDDVPVRYVWITTHTVTAGS